MKIQKDKVVTIDYTLTDELGTLLDTSKGQEPLVYLHGNGNLISGLENALEGKSSGENLKVSIPPAQAYGEWDKNKLVEVPKSQFVGVDELKVGMQFSAKSSAGEQVVTVAKIEGDKVTIDANHPLAGKTLNFDVSVVDVRDATSEELSHGHVHGPGGAH
ncbi:MAG TPA: peptidylprolyl isomerase [Bacteroidota bacterium]|nr:peptidylprolyl isomerase [Bacteroidota bacterium]